MRRRVVVLAGLLLLALLAVARANLVQFVASGGGSCCTFVSATYTQNDATTVTSISTSSYSVSSGNLLVVGCRNGGNSGSDTTTVTDTGSANTFTLINEITDTAGTVYDLFYAKNTAAVGSDVITCHFVNTSANTGIAVTQFSGANTSSTLDQNNTGFNGSAGSTLTCGSMTTTANNEVVVASGSMARVNNNWTAGSGFTLSTTNPTTSFMEYQILTSTTTLSAAATSDGSARWVINCASFK